MDLLNNPEEARSKLEYAISLDPGYSFTQGLMGDYYVKLSRTKTDIAERTEDLLTAQDYFREAVRVAKPAEKITKINYMVMIGNVFVELAGLNSEIMDPGSLRQAAEAYQDAILEDPAPADLARIAEQIARIYFEIGDRENALKFAQTSLANTVPEKQEQINQLISQIETLP
jgi:tetratricopeptide (TPR) repeat protein